MVLKLRLLGKRRESSRTDVILAVYMSFSWLTPRLDKRKTDDSINSVKTCRRFRKARALVVSVEVEPGFL